MPVEVRAERSQALAIRWLIASARHRSEQTLSARLYAELMEAANNRGAAVKKREDTHKTVSYTHLDVYKRQAFRLT